MGCDFFYSGSLPDPDLQEKVIRLVQSYYSNAIIIIPKPELTYLTFFDDEKHERNVAGYPFNFYGVVPGRKWLWEQGQFVFDRKDGGKLVRLIKVPDWCGISADDEVEYISKDDGIGVWLRSEGYSRLGGDHWPFALLLNIIRLRYWPELKVGDDYCVFEDVGEMLRSSDLISAMRDERLDFNTCEAIFEKYHAEHPTRREQFSAQVLVEQDLRVSWLHRETESIRASGRKVDDVAMEDLELSIRTGNCLRNAGIATIGQLLEYSPGELMKLKNFGRKSLNELLEILQVFGVHLRAD